MSTSNNIIFPERLRPGDMIAITAPSSGVPLHLHPQLDEAISHLRSRGYQVIEGKCLRAQYKNKSADKKLRAAELMSFLVDPAIKAIMPPWGGDLGMELLELMDFDQLRQCQPKWFIGFSDLTTFQFPLTILTGWATLHSPNLMQFGAELADKTTQGVWHILEGERGTKVQQEASSTFYYEGSHSGVKSIHPQTTEWKRLNLCTDEVCFQGRLIGGCLDIIGRLAGTRFGNFPQFRDAQAGEGVILFIENVEMGPCELTRALLSLRLQGWFTGLRGILIGRNAGPDISDSTQLNYLDALQAVLGDLSVPVLYDADIGHIPPQISLVNGAWAEVRFCEGRASVIQQLA